MRYSFFTVILALVSGVLGSVIFLQYFHPVGDNNQISNSIIQVQEDDQVTQVVEKVQESVVSVLAFSEIPQKLDFDFQKKMLSGGTGFIISEDGLIMTNKHVVQNFSADYKILMHDGSQFEAKIISIDEFDDIAILAIVLPADIEINNQFKPLELGESANLSVGQKVIAIGNALGLFENTVSTGILSAKGREVSAFNDAMGITQNLANLLQTDAAVNLGNSGGPLLDMQGKVIGMNVAVAENANGISFAIPIDDLRPVISGVHKFGKIVRPVLGVRFLMLTEVQAREIAPNLDGGALVIAEINGGSSGVLVDSSAEEAGILDRDVILTVNDEEVTNDMPLHKLIRKYLPGDNVILKIWRKGEIFELNVALGGGKISQNPA